MNGLTPGQIKSIAYIDKAKQITLEQRRKIELDEHNDDIKRRGIKQKVVKRPKRIWSTLRKCYILESEYPDDLMEQEVEFGELLGRGK